MVRQIDNYLCAISKTCEEGGRAHKIIKNVCFIDYKIIGSLRFPDN